MSWIDCDGYSWRLDNDVAKKLYTCLIKIPLPSNVNKKTLFVDFKSKHVTVKFKTKPEKTIIDRDLVHAIKVEDSTWTIETEKNDERFLILELSKRDNAEHWPKLFEGDDVTNDDIDESAMVDPSNPMSHVQAPKHAAKGEEKIKVLSVDDMMKEAQLQKLVSRLPEKARKPIMDMLSEGVPPTEVYDIVQNAIKSQEEEKKN